MKLLAAFLLLLLFSCGQKDSKDKRTTIDSVIAPPDSTIIKPSADSIPAVIGMESTVNTLLKNKYGDTWVVVNDVGANWPKDVYDYFVVTKRKTDPNYPYIAKGDYNGDGKEDLAALVNKKGTKEYQVAIISDHQSLTPVFYTWKEDIDVAAVSTYPKDELNGINGEKIKMKGDGVGIEYYETSSFVLYWNGTTFKRVWTGD